MDPAGARRLPRHDRVERVAPPGAPRTRARLCARARRGAGGRGRRHHRVDPGTQRPSLRRTRHRRAHGRGLRGRHRGARSCRRLPMGALRTAPRARASGALSGEPRVRHAAQRPRGPRVPRLLDGHTERGAALLLPPLDGARSGGLRGPPRVAAEGEGLLPAARGRDQRGLRRWPDRRRAATAIHGAATPSLALPRARHAMGGRHPRRLGAQPGHRRARPPDGEGGRRAGGRRALSAHPRRAARSSGRSGAAPEGRHPACGARAARRPPRVAGAGRRGRLRRAARALASWKRRASRRAAGAPGRRRDARRPLGRDHDVLLEQRGTSTSSAPIRSFPSPA